MKVFTNLSITYRLRKSKDPNFKGAKVIYCRIKLDSSRADFSTKQRISEKQWCKITERVKGSSQGIETINLYLDSLTKRLTDLYLKHRGGNNPSPPCVKPRPLAAIFKFNYLRKSVTL